MPKIIKFHDWQINESPDYLEYIDDKGVVIQETPNSIDSVTFSLDQDNKAVVNFVTGGYHPDMNYEYEKRGLKSPKGSNSCDFTGRLWLNSKIISFWFTPKNQKELQQHLEELDQDLRAKEYIGEDETIFNSGWRVENYRDDYNKGYGNMEYISSFDKKIREPIPLEDFTYQEFDADAYKVHLMNTKEKESYYKKHGKSKGFGSDKTVWNSGKNNIAWRQAKRLSENADLDYVGSILNIDNTPDNVDFLGLTSHDSDAISFIYDDYNEEWLFSEPGQGHEYIYTRDDLSIYDSDDWSYNGRLWEYSKVMIFWKYPDREKFDELLTELKNLGFDIDNDWKVITVPNDRTDGFNWGKMPKEYEKNIVLVPIDEYKKEDTEDFSDEQLIVHMMNAKEKEEYYKKHGKPKGFGSDAMWNKVKGAKSLSSDREMTPIEWEQAKKTSESKIITFEKFNKKI